MKTVVCQLALTLALVLAASAQSPETPATPTWENKIAKGFLPYRQLMVLELGKAIRKRLDAIPVSTKSPSDSNLATPVASPATQPTAPPAPK